MKESFYFKHDYNSRNDPKMVKLRRELGASGYGVLWMLIEQLHENGGRISHDPEFIAWDLREPRELVEKVIGSSVFFVEDGMIGSPRVDREREERRQAQELGREHAISGWKKRKGANGGPMGGHRGPKVSAIPGEGEREEKEKEITAAPSAADHLIGKAVGAAEARRVESRLSDYRLPFDFGGIAKGVHIQDLCPTDCQEILNKVPRLGAELTAVLKARIAQKKGEARK